MYDMMIDHTNKIVNILFNLDSGYSYLTIIYKNVYVRESVNHVFRETKSRYLDS